MDKRDTAEVEIDLSGFAGPSFPVEEYGRAGLSNPGAGYAARGYFLKAGLDVFNSYGVGFFISGVYNENRMRGEEYGEALQYVNRPNRISNLESGSGYEMSLISGLALKVKIEEDFEISARAGAGISSSRYRPLVFTITDQRGEEFRVNELAHVQQGFVGTGGFALRYRVDAQVGVSLSAQYLAGRFEHEQITQRITRVRTNDQFVDEFDQTKKVKVFQLGVGLNYRL